MKACAQYFQCSLSSDDSDQNQSYLPINLVHESAFYRINKYSVPQFQGSDNNLKRSPQKRIPNKGKRSLRPKKDVMPTNPYLQEPQRYSNHTSNPYMLNVPSSINTKIIDMKQLLPRRHLHMESGHTISKSSNYLNNTEFNDYEVCSVKNIKKCQKIKFILVSPTLESLNSRQTLPYRRSFNTQQRQPNINQNAKKSLKNSSTSIKKCLKHSQTHYNIDINDQQKLNDLLKQSLEKSYHQQTNIPYSSGLPSNPQSPMKIQPNYHSQQNHSLRQNSCSDSSHFNINRTNQADINNDSKSFFKSQQKDMKDVIIKEANNDNTTILKIGQTHFTNKSKRPSFMYRSASNLEKFQFVRAESVGASSESSEHFSQVVFRSQIPNNNAKIIQHSNHHPHDIALLNPELRQLQDLPKLQRHYSQKINYQL